MERKEFTATICHFVVAYRGSEFLANSKGGIPLLTRITELPTDKRIAGVHCIPVLANGDMVMVWDQEEQTLTTIGGRLEGNETIEEGLHREAMEEAGIVLAGERYPFACWYWKETDTYTVFFLTRVGSFHRMPEGFEKTGYVIMSFRTAAQMINAIEGPGLRMDLIAMAEQHLEPFLACEQEQGGII